MNIERAITRLRAIYGWQPVGILLAIALMFALVIDHFTVQYLELSEEVETLAKKTTDMKTHVEREKKTAELLQERTARLAAQRARVHQAATPEQAGAALVEDVRGLLDAARARQVAIQALPPEGRGGFGVIRAEGNFDALTQQLVTLLENIGRAPRAMKITELRVGVMESEGRPSALNVRLAVQGFHADPARDAKPAGGGTGATR